ncbi:MAG: hypothetical protein ABI629_11190 [bacterium]
MKRSQPSPDRIPTRRWGAVVARLVGCAVAACVFTSGLVTGWGCSDCDLSVSTHALPDATVGVRYNSSLNSNCGGDAWFLQTGSLPPGIGLQQDGDLGGTPTLSGTYTFTVGVFDFPSGQTAYKGLSIIVDDAATPTPTLTPGLSPTPEFTATPALTPTAG